MLRISTFALCFGTLLGTLLGADTARMADKKPRRLATILFDDLPDPASLDEAKALGASAYIVIYQASDPNAIKTGEIDVPRVLEYIRGLASKAPLPAWGMLDFEDPFHEHVQKPGASEEHRRAVNSMIHLVQSVRRDFPGTKWTYYGVPFLPYWPKSESWVTANATVKRDAINAAIASYSELVSELDWISPTIYAKYDPREFPGQPPEQVRAAGRAWRAAEVGLAKLMANGKPVIPTVCPWWSIGGKAPVNRFIDRRQVLVDQVIPAIEMGADGVAFWNALGYVVDMTTASQDRENRYPKSELVSWRAAIQADYFVDNPVSDWSAPGVRSAVAAKLSATMVRGMQDVAEWQRNGTTPPGQ
jgi:hypothetical protein